MQNEKKYLKKNEVVLTKIHKHWVVFLPSFLTLLITAIISLKLMNPTLLVFPAIFLFIAIFQYSCSYVVFTNKRIIAETGFFKPSCFISTFKKIEKIIIYPSCFGTILGYESLSISASNKSIFVRQMARSSLFFNDFLKEKE